LPELFINPLALTELRHGNKGRAEERGVAGGERSCELARAEAEQDGKGAERKRMREKEKACVYICVSVCMVRT